MMQPPPNQGSYRQRAPGFPTGPPSTQDPGHRSHGFHLQPSAFNSNQTPAFNNSQPPSGFNSNQPPPGFSSGPPPRAFNSSQLPRGFNNSQRPLVFNNGQPPPGFNNSQPPRSFSSSQSPLGYNNQAPPPFNSSQAPPGRSSYQPPGGFNGRDPAPRFDGPQQQMGRHSRPPAQGSNGALPRHMHPGPIGSPPGRFQRPGFNPNMAARHTAPHRDQWGPNSRNQRGPNKGDQWGPNSREQWGPNKVDQWGPNNGNNGHQQQRGKQKKKAKVDKRDLPENNAYYCDSCDRGYKDEDKYHEHVANHQKCSVDGCTYVAAPKLVTMHVNLQHRTGLAKKIWSLESEEDIKKWREERRKNFPTAENQARRAATDADRQSRGEVIETKYFGKMRGRGRGRGRGQQNSGRGQQNSGRSNEKRDIPDGKEHTPGKRRKLDGNNQRAAGADGSDKATTSTRDPNTDPLSLILSRDHTDSSSGEDEVTTATDVTAAGALSKLITSYHGCGDSEQVQDVADSALNEVNNNGSKRNSRADGPRQRQRNRGRKNRQNQSMVPKLDKSLLEKLLAREIRQERNQILQCVYYIVNNRFFGVGTGDKSGDVGEPEVAGTAAGVVGATAGADSVVVSTDCIMQSVKTTA